MIAGLLSVTKNLSRISLLCGVVVISDILLVAPLIAWNVAFEIDLQEEDTLGTTFILVFWVALLVLRITVIPYWIDRLFWYSALMKVFGHRLAQKSHSEIQIRDGRQPVLFLRSFGDDYLRFPRRRLPWLLRAMISDVHLRSVIGDLITVEQLIVDCLAQCGPVIALRRPREAIPPLGAARLSVANDRWQQEIEHLCQVARLVVVVIGRAEYNSGLSWEINHITADDLLLRKCVFIMPPVATDEAELRWQQNRRLIGAALPEWQPGMVAVVCREASKAHIFKTMNPLDKAQYFSCLTKLVQLLGPVSRSGFYGIRDTVARWGGWCLPFGSEHLYSSNVLAWCLCLSYKTLGYILVVSVIVATLKTVGSQ